jgi:hypothetical protein
MALFFFGLSFIILGMMSLNWFIVGALREGDAAGIINMQGYDLTPLGNASS